MPTTPKKNLRDLTPVWAETPRIRVRARSRLERETCDVAVIGAGISGALCALALAEKGHDVVIVDRRPPCHGSTMASTAMIQFELDTTLTDLAERIGARDAERAYRRSLKAVDALDERVAKYGLTCGWRRRHALYLAGDSHGWRALEAEAAYRAKIGLPSQFVDHDRLSAVYGIERTGAVLSDGAAEVNPVQLAAGCLRAAQRLGARIYSPHDVQGVRPAARGVELKTAKGGEISARRAVFTTGYEVLPELPHDAFDIISTWALATQPLAAEDFWPGRCLIWEASEPYLYLRSTWDNRILAGGEDSGLTQPQRRKAAAPNKGQRLLAKLNTLLPGRDLRIDYLWAGAFADSPTGLPHISPVRGLDNCFAVLACGGNGITFSVIASEMVRHWVEGSKDADADLFV